MAHYSRREFMAQSAAAAGLMALQTQPLFADAAKPADMTIAKWTGEKPNDELIKQIAGKLTRQALEGLGGLKRFMGKGDVVWIKPNIGWDRTPEQAANTNPEVVVALIQMCFDAGAKKVKVGDNTCHKAVKTYETSGIAAAARAAGAEVLFLDENRFKEANIGGERVKTLPIYPEAFDCDLMINVPVVKHHVLAKLTMCMKNYMGVIENRKSFHQDLPTCICDITRYAKPRLCVLDAVRVLTAHGPSGGKLEDVQVKTTIAAGVDIVALDAWGAEVIGQKAADIGTIVKAEQVGLGKMDYRKLALREISVA